MKTYRIRPVDRRFTGYGKWAWIIDVHGDISGPKNISHRLILFNQIRDWCWSTWGSSCERDKHSTILEHNPNAKLNPHWVWNTEFYHLSLYLKTDQELALFKLKW